MPGFIITTLRVPLQKKTEQTRISGTLGIERFTAARSTIPKFEKDKLFTQNENYAIITDGVITNRAELVSRHNPEGTFFDTIVDMHLKYGDSFFHLFRGSFSGAIYNKSSKKWVVFTNQLGDKPIFYWHQEDNLAIASELPQMKSILAANQREATINEEAMYHLLTYGYMESDGTPLKGVHRLEAGQYLTYEHSTLEKKAYYSLSDCRYDLADVPDELIIDELDTKFRKAVISEYEKDREYGYTHLANLSAGLDARVSIFCATSMGYRPDAMTFSQSGALDHLIAQEMASHLGINFYFKSLDSPTFIFDIDRTMERNSGIALFSGPSGGPQFYDALNFAKYGVVHSGQLGDVIVGTYLKYGCTNALEDRSGLYSSKLSHRLPPFKPSHKSRELYMLNVRGFKGILSSHLLFQSNTEILSPFCDPDVIDFCLSIPVERRKGHALYKKWLLLKYPEAANFVWDTTRDKIYWPKKHTIRENSTKLFRRLGQDAPRKAARVLRGLIAGKKLHPNVGMTPFEYWYQHLDSIRLFMDTYFNDHIRHPAIDEQLRKDMLILYHSGNAIEKTQVLSVLSLYKLLID